MYCHIFDNKSVAPSSGYFRRQPVPQESYRQDQEFKTKDFLVGRLLSMFLGNGRLMSFQNTFFYMRVVDPVDNRPSTV